MLETCVKHRVQLETGCWSPLAGGNGTEKVSVKEILNTHTRIHTHVHTHTQKLQEHTV